MGIDWRVEFRTRRPLPSLPQLLMLAQETVADATYHHEGRYRQGEAQCVFQYTLSGRGVFRDAAGGHDVPPGTGFLCRVADPQTAYFHPPEATEPWSFLWINYSGPAAEALTADWVRRFGAVLTLGADDPALERLRMHKRGAVVREVDAMTGGRVVMDLLLRLAEVQDVPEEEGAARTLVRQALLQMEAHVRENLNVSELAGMLQVSREHLARVFREQTGESPYAYMKRRRLLGTARLLKETALPIKEIAIRYGYESPAHFTRSFRRVFAMSPSRFRRVGSVPMV